MNLNRIEAINSNKKESFKPIKKNFENTLSGLDTFQGLLMKEKYTNLMKNSNKELMSNGYESIKDNLDYTECVNGHCSKLNNEKMEKKEKDLVKDKKSDNTNTIMKNLDILVSLIYIFLLVILLLGSIIKKDANNLINILILTLLYLFYQIYMGYKK
jgi:cation transport ATPase